ncbi:FtsH protease activity modulator HflK [Actinobacillus delphinicola]|uniref:Protein HflK n=1 Tax=Actinobacillus delphinicola TaxID=51161 RepID=A0A448TSH5_9PAST|nr:FtsH protease activity modulator HflK [Actinobacillus delphinicola]VEJ08949.1 protein HflK [Actinobacillus delphinicola]
MSMNNSDQDPWSKPGEQKPNGNQRPQQNGQGNQEQSPPDLEEMFNNLLKKLGSGGRGNKTPRSSNASPLNWKKIIPAAIVVAVGIWGASGFYTIKEADRGVVLQFGKLDGVVQPGLNWKPTFIDRVIPVNVEQVKELHTSGSMLTQDENMVKVAMTVQYRVEDPAKYLFSVTNPNESLMQATDSALRYVIGNMNMDEILTTGRSVVREKTWKAIEQIIKPYNMGLEILDVNFQSARPPEEVKAAFDDAIKAQEDEQRYIREAEAYARAKAPIARGEAQQIVQSANAYKEQVVLNAQGEVERYQRLLPEYLANPKLLRERIYLQTMEKIMAETPKVVMDNSNALNILPLNKLMETMKTAPKKAEQKSVVVTHADTPALEKKVVTTSDSDGTFNIYSDRKGRFN